MTPTIKTDHMNVRSKLSMLQHMCADEDASSLGGIISHDARCGVAIVVCVD